MGEEGKIRLKRGKKGIVEKGMGEEGRKEMNGGKGVKGLMVKGYTKLIVWKNACELRKLVYEITKKFPRSIKQNIQEGYKRSSIGDYIHHLSIAQGSLGELSGDVDDCLEDNLINNREYAVLNNLIVRTDYLLMRLIQSLTKKKLEVTA
ncbi:MAG: four helix bundle protein [candidate division WOR-3 bacterium]